MDSILIVDDMEINRMILSEILCGQYNIIEAESGVKAIEILSKLDENPAAVLLDIIMPEMDGFEVLNIMKSNFKTKGIPVLFITAADSDTNESRGLREGAADYISKPFNPDVVKTRVDSHIQLKRYHENLESLLEHKTAQMVADHERTLETLATIVEYRSLESGTHIRRSCELTKLLVNSLLTDSKYSKQLLNAKYTSMIKAVALHDIGKVGIPDIILLKPGSLTKDEFDVIKEHTLIGNKIIEMIADGADDDARYFYHCKNICLSHHERWDGKGYPNGLRGDDIPLSARILSIVDVYDALTNKRCYKPAMPHDEALQILFGGSGSQFDPDIIAHLNGELAEKFSELEQKMGGLSETNTVSRVSHIGI